jgi:GNAT superfamily N-acetyltransferase
MLEPARYSSTDSLSNGQQVEIRALKPEDHSAFLAAIERTSAGSLYRRFFGVKRYFTSEEVEFFLRVDFVTHVALVAVVEELGQSAIVGAGRYIVGQPNQAELAFAVIDQFQGLGIGKALLHHLAAVAREAGLKELFAEVLPDNLPMLRVFEKSRLDVAMKRGPTAVNVVLRLG